jgi:hypothetical protein
MDSVSRYESRCPKCNVTFPIETKVCIHCDGRTGPSHVQLPDPPPGSSTEIDPATLSEILQRRQQEAEPGHVQMEDVEEETVRASPLRSLITLVWVALAIGISVLRACGESQP